MTGSQIKSLLHEKLRQSHPLPVLPNPYCEGLTARVFGTDQDNQALELDIVEEQAWTLYCNAQEIVTVMTIGDYPSLLGLGYLANQQLVPQDSLIEDIEVDQELRVIVVRTNQPEEAQLSRRVRTSGCAEGTMFEKVINSLQHKQLATEQILSARTILTTLQHINTLPSLYLAAGAIHGCVLCRETEVIAYLEDVGRHNAVDKIAGLMYAHGLNGAEHWLYTTGRLTTEMVLKAVQMDIPIVISRSGFTAAGAALAEQCGITLIGRARGKRFQLLCHPERISSQERT